MDALWTQYQVTSAVNKLDAQGAPTREDLDAMRDEEIEHTLSGGPQTTRVSLR
jgi:hypothetical protein